MYFPPIHKPFQIESSTVPLHPFIRPLFNFIRYKKVHHPLTIVVPNHNNSNLFLYSTFTSNPIQSVHL